MVLRNFFQCLYFVLMILSRKAETNKDGFGLKQNKDMFVKFQKLFGFLKSF